MTDHEPDDSPGDEPADDHDASDTALPVRLPPDPTVPSATARTVASLIDALFAVVVYIVSSSAILLVLHPKTGQRLTEAQTILVSLTFSGFAVLVFASLERTGGTPGRRVTRLRLVTLERTLPGWSPILVRYIAVFIPLISILGVLLVFGGVMVSSFQRQRRDAFDLLSRTRVVPVGQVVTSADSPS